MRKENLFVFITLLPIAIQAQNLEFSVNSLFNLHNVERESHQLRKLTLDPDLSSRAMELASKMINGKINDCEKDKKINEFWHKNKDSRLTPEMVFEDWLSEEVDIINNKKSIVCPAKIFWKDTKLIGIGHETLNDETVVVALYQPYNENC